MERDSDYHQRHFARSSREAFGTPYYPPEGGSAPTFGVAVIFLAYAVIFALIAGVSYYYYYESRAQDTKLPQPALLPTTADAQFICSADDGTEYLCIKSRRFR